MQQWHYERWNELKVDADASLSNSFLCSMYRLLSNIALLSDLYKCSDASCSLSKLKVERQVVLLMNTKQSITLKYCNWLKHKYFVSSYDCNPVLYVLCMYNDQKNFIQFRGSYHFNFFHYKNLLLHYFTATIKRLYGSLLHCCGKRNLIISVKLDMREVLRLYRKPN